MTNGYRCQKCGAVWPEDQIRRGMTDEERRDLIKGRFCPKCQNLPFFEEERTRVVNSIISTINEIELQVERIEQMLEKSQHPFSTQQQADAIIGDFFFFCQVVEDQVKFAQKEKYIPPAQVTNLHTQLEQTVSKMYQLAKRSEQLSNAFATWSVYHLFSSELP